MTFLKDDKKSNCVKTTCEATLSPGVSLQLLKKKKKLENSALKYSSVLLEALSCITFVLQIPTVVLNLFQ